MRAGIVLTAGLAITYRVSIDPNRPSSPPPNSFPNSFLGTVQSGNCFAQEMAAGHVTGGLDSAVTYPCGLPVIEDHVVDVGGELVSTAVCSIRRPGSW